MKFKQNHYRSISVKFTVNMQRFDSVEGVRVLRVKVLQVKILTVRVKATNGVWEVLGERGRGMV